MERSSPLAAMQPQSVPFGSWGLRLDAASSNAQYAAGLSFRVGNFNFKDISMHRPSSDYFDLNPRRTASPTASLVADLSQNFHIDRSPLPPTPRRSLFTTNILGQVHHAHELMSTPPAPLSSPCPIDDLMDISPLPHKLPFLACVNVQPPTPDPTPTQSANESSPACIPESPSEQVRVPHLPERRRSSLLRPSLLRTKCYSTTAVSVQSAGLDRCRVPFKFGNGSLTSTNSGMSLEECFVESPQQTTFQSFGVGPPRPRSASNKISCPYGTGSPSNGHVRKSSAPSQRPRKQFRRSLSMFEHPAEMLSPQKLDQRTDCGLAPLMDIDEAHQLKLPHFLMADDAIPRITRETMIDVLDGKYGSSYEEKLVVDCRFEYEYKGGHIDGAVNFNDKEELACKLFEDASMKKTLLIFHCEYSAHRAPIAAKFIRHRDRAENAHQYPQLTYPEVYILDGGYSSFFKDHKLRCYPQEYVEMNAKEHENACERGLGRIKQHRGKLSRAQTFAFGQQSPNLEDSPTAGNRSCTNLMMGMDLSTDTPMDLKRSQTRRMASY